MKRRFLAIQLIMVLIAGTLGAIPTQSLVCRFTGVPMPAAPETKSCCSADTKIDAHAPAHVAIADTGCCEIRQSPDRPDAPALAFVSHSVVATAPVAPVIFIPSATTIIVPIVPDRPSAPRAPPGSIDTSRAPPSLS